MRCDVYSLSKPIALQKWHWSGTISMNKSKSSVYSRECSAISVTDREYVTPLTAVAHMDGAVGSESTAGIWSRHPDCICCCDIKSAAYTMQPCNPPSADNGATMAILKTCLPIPHLMSWAAQSFSSNYDNLYKYRPELAQSKLLAHDRFWLNSLDGVFMPSLLSSVLYAVELERPRRIWMIEVGRANSSPFNICSGVARNTPSVMELHGREFR